MKKSRKGWKIVGIVVAVLIVLGVIVGTQQGSSTSGSNSGKQQAQATTTSQGMSGQSGQTGQSAPTKGTFAQFSDGTYTVGKNIQPGTYRTRAASPKCYYARLNGFGGTLNDIITNNNTDNPAIVTISATDKGFQSTNCGTWTQNLSAITTSQTSFPDGMYIVGTDMQPGTYKSSGQIDCYYARLSGFSNLTGDIIANENTNTPAIVTISASDKGFQSNGCGSWTKE